MDEPNDPVEPSTLAWVAVPFYAAMAGIGVLVMWLGDLDIVRTVFGVSSATEPPNVALHMLIGSAAGLMVVLLGWLARDLASMSDLKRRLADMVGPQSTGTIAMLAITSAVGEEVLFRGALHGLLGFWPTAIIFGVLHGGHDPKLWGWALFGIAFGIMMGGLVDLTGNLLAPMLAHLTVNYWNLHALVKDA